MDTTLQQQEPNMSSLESAAKPEPRRRGQWRLLMLGAVVVLAGLLALEMLPRGQQHMGLAETTPPAQPTVLSVQVVTPKRSAASSELLLPGNVQAIQEASMFARTNGYVKRRLVDIGDRVSAGQLLAEIEAPEVDQELLQARASLEQMQANVQQARANVQQVQANVDLARITSERWRQLEQEQVIPRQQSEEKQAAYAVVQANMNAAQANVNLVIRADGPQVATVQQDQTVRYQKVQVERDYGTEVEISAGLNGDESLVVNPTNDLHEGAQVQAVAVQQKAK